MNRGTRQIIAAVLSVMLPAAYGQTASTAFDALTVNRPTANILVRPYLAPTVPGIRLENSGRIKALVRGGALYLTAQDAVALAVENNIDLEVARYNALISDWRLERSKAGGALPGVPSTASQAGTVASGQGVQGSQSSAGVSGGNAGGGTSSTNATITQIGPVTQVLDPLVQQTSTFTHASEPQANTTQSLTSVLISNSRFYSTQVQQGFLSGGQVTLKATDSYLNQNSPSDFLNPSWAPNLSISFQQALLRGFGSAVNARNITVARINRRNADLNFKASVITVVANVLDSYYQLAAAYEDVKAKRSASEIAETLLGNVRRQVELGSVAPPELITSDNLTVTSRQDLVNSQATLDQLQNTLKNLLSRTGSADPVLGPARIVPVDTLAMPADDGVGDFAELLKEARANRVEFALDQANLESSRTSLLGTRNGVLPNVQAFGSENQAGLGGVQQSRSADGYFIGGLGTGVGQVLRRNFPTERGGAFASVPIGNHLALADQTIDELTLRQSELAVQKRLKQVEVDLQNGVIALRQARSSYDAVVRNRQLQEQLVTAEQKKYELGASFPSNVIQVQRDLVNAQSTQLGALTNYIRARVSLERTLGRTLESAHVTLDEALAGQLRAK